MTASDRASPAPGAAPPPSSPPRAGAEFGQAAARLAGTCSVLFGWSPDEFWRATPAEVAGVVAALAPPDARAVDAAELARMRERLDG